MPGIANRTVPRLRAQPGSLLSLLPVRNVKDQPVGGSRREQTHTYTYNRVHNTLCIHTHTHRRAQAQRDRNPCAQWLTETHTHTPAQTHSSLANCAITSWGLQPGQTMRPQPRWFKTPRWVPTPSARWSSPPEWQQNCNAAPQPLNVEMYLC